MNAELSEEALQGERVRQRIRFAVDAAETMPDYMRRTLRNQRIMIGLVALLVVIHAAKLILHIQHL